MASNDWLVAVLEAKGIPKRTNKKIYHPSVLNTDPNVYASLAIISAGDVVPHDGRCTRRPFGMLIGYDQYVSESAEKFKAENALIVWNTAVIVRKGLDSIIEGMKSLSLTSFVCKCRNCTWIKSNSNR